MNKTIKIILALATVLCLLTGCGIREYVGLNISKNKDVKLEIITAMDDELIDAYLDMGESSSEDVSGEKIELNSGESIVEDYTEYEDLITVDPVEDDAEPVQVLSDDDFYFESSSGNYVDDYASDYSGDDTSIDISSLFGTGSGESKYTDADRWNYLESTSSDAKGLEDFKRTKYEVDGFKGFKYTKKLGKLDDLVAEGSANISSISELESGDNKFISKSGDVYSINIPIASTEDLANAEAYKDYGIDAEFKFYITLPSPAVSNNATEVSEDKLTYTWDLFNTENVEISFTMEDSGSFPWIPVIIGAVAVLAIVCIACKAKKGKKEE